MKKLIYVFLINIFITNYSSALIEVDITRGNLDPLPIAVSPLHVDIKSEKYKDLNVKELGEKISGRTALSPAAMESTHDLDFLLWCLQPRRPVKVYSQTAGKLFSKKSNTPDHQWIIVTLDDGMTITVGGGWILPLGYPNYSHTWIEVIGTDGSLFIDDSHKDVHLNTVKDGIRYPMSSMPGEPVEHTHAGPMHEETMHFINAVATNKPVLVKPEEAKAVMELYIAADLSAESGEPITLPRNK